MKNLVTYFLLILLSLSISSFAADKAVKGPQRKTKSAETKSHGHQETIDCLKKGLTEEECEEEALKECPMIKNGSCPTMEGGLIHIYDDEQ